MLGISRDHNDVLRRVLGAWLTGYRIRICLEIIVGATGLSDCKTCVNKFKKRNGFEVDVDVEWLMSSM